MSKDDINDRWIAVTCLALVAGAVLTVYAAAHVRGDRVRLGERAADVAELSVLAGEMANYVEAQKAYSAMPVKRPLPLGELVRRSFPQYPFDEKAGTVRNLTDGWIARRYELNFNAVSVGPVIQFAAAAESVQGRPPWRVVRLRIQSMTRPNAGASDTRSAGGYGNVLLVLEAVEKSGS